MSKEDSLILKRFGKYLLLDHFVDGGMAKICRARFLGEQADKIVAIKMIQSQYFSDEAFRNMFLDEIKVTFGLIHPNITQTFDYGMEDGQLYQVMEYVNGKNLKEYLDKLKKRGYVFPVEVSVYVIAQACQGLHYAHTFTNQLTGESANIIHRDISPHNIMLTYDGAVKIIDFGIAKANSNSDKTQAGTIKGKLSYLAPEYLDGIDLDPRYDQFAIGITLWEMLCSRKLFSAKNDLAVLKKIQSCKIPPPSSINPNVPKALDKIVLKALDKDRELRYDNLDQMNRALIKFLYSKYPEFNATDLSYFAQELFKDVIKQDKEKFKDFGKVDIHPFLEEMRKGTPVAQNAQIYEDDVIIIEDEADEEQLDGHDEQSAIRSATRKTELDLVMSDTDAGPSLEMEKTSTLSDRISKPKPKPAAARSAGTATRTSRKLPTGATGARPNALRKRPTTASGTNTKTRTSVRPSVGTRTGVRINRSASGTKTGVRTRVSGTRTRTRRDSYQPKTHGGGSLFKILVAGLCIMAAWFGYDKYYKDQFTKPKISPPIVKKVVKPAIHRKVASTTGTLVLENFTNFDKMNHKLFINGKQFTGMANVLIGEIENFQIPKSESVTIRIVYNYEKAFFVKQVKFADGVGRVTVPPVEHMDDQKYSYLRGGSTCHADGQIFFKTFGEDRIENIPIMAPTGIAFPLGIHDIRFVPINSEKVDYKEIKLRVNFEMVDNQIDICKEIIHALENN